MFRSTTLFALLVATLITPTFAGFVITRTIDRGPTTDTYNLFAQNTGGATGEELVAVDFFATVISGNARFQGNAANGRPTGSSLTNPSLGTAVSRFSLDQDGNIGDNGFIPAQGIIPSGSWGTVISGTGNSAIISAKQFGAAIVATRDVPNGIVYPAEVAPGRQFLRIVVNNGATIQFTRLALGGTRGEKVEFASPEHPFYVHHIVDPVPPVIVANTGADIVFGSIVSTPLPFIGTVTVTDGDRTDTLSLIPRIPPAGISELVVSPASATGGTVDFTISGKVAYPGSNSTISIPFTVSDQIGFGESPTGTFDIRVTPEPASLALFGLGGLLLGRRR